MAYQRTEIAAADIAQQMEICKKVKALHEEHGRRPLALVDTYGCQQNEADIRTVKK